MAKKKENRITVGGNMSGGVRTVILSQTRRESIDIATYIKSVKAAENVDFPNRSLLCDVMENIITDAHLSAVRTKRKSAILNSPIEFKRGGVVDQKIALQIRSPWFYNLLSDIHDSLDWGYTPLQFYVENGWINYDLIPRKHVDPVRRIILRRQTDITGVPFDEFSNFVLVGKPHDLGLLTKAAPLIIYKRNTLADWAQFSELFGQPLREGTYDGWDEEARAKLMEDLIGMGGSAVLLHPKNTDIRLVESSAKSASSQLCKDFCDTCNNELSKLYLGNTLTTESNNTGTQALGTVHKSVEERIESADKQYLLNILNYDLADTFAALGIDTSGGEFYFTAPQDTNLSSRIDIDMKLRSMGLPLDDDYLYEAYGRPKPDNYEELKKRLIEEAVSKNEPKPYAEDHNNDEPEPEAEPSPKENKTLTNTLKRFFGFAPEGKGALDW